MLASSRRALLHNLKCLRVATLNPFNVLRGTNKAKLSFSASNSHKCAQIITSYIPVLWSPDLAPRQAFAAVGAYYLLH